LGRGGHSAGLAALARRAALHLGESSMMAREDMALVNGEGGDGGRAKGAGEDGERRDGEEVEEFRWHGEGRRQGATGK
jgi:hypothetical protein